MSFGAPFPTDIERLYSDVQAQRRPIPTAMHIIPLLLLAFLLSCCHAKCSFDKDLQVGHYWDLHAFGKANCKKDQFYNATGPAGGPNGGGCWNLPRGAVSWIIRDTPSSCRVTGYNLRDCKGRGKNWDRDNRPWVKSYKAGGQSNLRYQEWGIHSYKVKCVYDK